MKKKTIAGLIALVAIIAVIIFAGCVEKETITPSTPRSTSTPLAPTATPDVVEPFIDPQLKNIPVTCSNPNIKTISYRLMDKRTYQEDYLNWGINLTVQNIGDVPVWITKYARTDYPTTSHTYSLLKSGERKLFTTSARCLGTRVREGTYLYVTPETLKAIVIESYNTVNPSISPELKNSEISVYSTYKRPIDINSIKYELDERNWRYITLVLTNRHNDWVSLYVYLPWFTASESYSASVEPGKSVSIKIPLKEHNVREVRSIKFNVY
jgi:hypothetical protein